MGTSCLNVDLSRAAFSKRGRRPCCKNAIFLQLQAQHLWFGTDCRARVPCAWDSSATVPHVSPVPNAWLLSIPCCAGVQHRGRPAVHQEAHRQSNVNHDKSNSQVCPRQAGGNQSPGTWHESLGRGGRDSIGAAALMAGYGVLSVVNLVVVLLLSCSALESCDLLRRCWWG